MVLMRILTGSLCAALWLSGPFPTAAQTPSDPPPADLPTASPATDAETPAGEESTAGADAAPNAQDGAQAERVAWFTKHLTGATLTGRFTIIGRDQAELPEEEYVITKCEKLEQANMYRITARIKYGDVDQELPLDLPVLWAGDTPVISLTNMWIPGLGTFSTRVLFYGDSYAGTWSHGEVRGHMFGVVEQDGQTQPPSDQAESAAEARR